MGSFQCRLTGFDYLYPIETSDGTESLLFEKTSLMADEFEYDTFEERERKHLYIFDEGLTVYGLRTAG